MENQSESTFGEGSYLPNKHKQFEIHNANREEVLIDTLSNEQVKHSGRIVFNDDNFENTSLIRLQYDIDVFNFLTRKFYVMGKKINLSSYFSINQYQSTILDIPFSCKLNELGLKIPLKHREFCQVTIFEGKGEPLLPINESRLINAGKPLSMEMRYTLPNKEVYVVIKNTTSKSKEVNLIDLAQGKNIPQGIVIENSGFNLEGGTDFNLLKIWSKNNTHLCEPVYYSYGEVEEKIAVQNYFSAMQWQSNMIDVPHDFKIITKSKIMVNLPSNARTMYSFL